MKKSIITILISLCLGLFIFAVFHFSKNSGFSYQALHGEWSRCIDGQLKQTYTFEKDGHYKNQKEYYLTKNDCQGTLSYTYTLEASYEIKNKENLENAVVFILVLNIQKASLKLAHQDTVSVYNERTVCDIGDWKLDEEKLVTGIEVDDCSQYQTGITIYRKVLLQENSFKLGEKSFNPDVIPEEFKPGFYMKAK